jgi:hypothetical protein
MMLSTGHRGSGDRGDARSAQRNLTLSGGVQYQDLEDRRPDRTDGKTSRSLPLALSADRRDGIGGGGVTYGALGVTAGSLSLDAAQRAEDVLGTGGLAQPGRRTGRPR